MTLSFSIPARSSEVFLASAEVSHRNTKIVYNKFFNTTLPGDADKMHCISLILASGHYQSEMLSGSTSGRSIAREGNARSLRDICSLRAMFVSLVLAICLAGFTYADLCQVRILLSANAIARQRVFLAAP